MHVYLQLEIDFIIFFWTLSSLTKLSFTHLSPALMASSLPTPTTQSVLISQPLQILTGNKCPRDPICCIGNSSSPVSKINQDFVSGVLFLKTSKLQNQLRFAHFPNPKSRPISWQRRLATIAKLRRLLVVLLVRWKRKRLRLEKAGTMRLGW